MDDATLAALRTAASAVFDIGFATMIGTLATLALLREARSDWATRCVRRSRRLFTLATVLALTASLGWMDVQVSAMTDLSPGAALLAAGGVIVDTQFGRAWVPGTLALAASLALPAWFRSGPLPLRWLASAVAVVAVVAASHASTGHAGANGWGWLTLVMTLHLLAIGTWSGAVFAAALAPPGAGGVDGARYAAALSTLATAALAGVVLTGVPSASHGLAGSLAPLVPATATPWGIVLDVKLGLVATAVALGGFNRVVALPALRATPDSPSPWRRFTAVLRLEAVVLLAALVAAALLANGEPPAV